MSEDPAEFVCYKSAVRFGEPWRMDPGSRGSAPVCSVWHRLYDSTVTLSFWGYLRRDWNGDRNGYGDGQGDNDGVRHQDSGLGKEWTKGRNTKVYQGGHRDGASGHHVQGRGVQARKVGSWERMHHSRGIHGRSVGRLQVRRVRRSVDRTG